MEADVKCRSVGLSFVDYNVLSWLVQSSRYRVSIPQYQACRSLLEKIVLCTVGNPLYSISSVRLSVQKLQSVDCRGSGVQYTVYMFIAGN